MSDNTNANGSQQPNSNANHQQQQQGSPRGGQNNNNNNANRKRSNSVGSNSNQNSNGGRGGGGGGYWKNKNNQRGGRRGGGGSFSGSPNANSGSPGVSAFMNSSNNVSNQSAFAASSSSSAPIASNASISSSNGGGGRGSANGNWRGGGQHHRGGRGGQRRNNNRNQQHTSNNNNNSSSPNDNPNYNSSQSDNGGNLKRGRSACNDGGSSASESVDRPMSHGGGIRDRRRENANANRNNNGNGKQKNQQQQQNSNGNNKGSNDAAGAPHTLKTVYISGPYRSGGGGNNNSSQQQQNTADSNSDDTSAFIDDDTLVATVNCVGVDTSDDTDGGCSPSAARNSAAVATSSSSARFADRPHHRSSIGTNTTPYNRPRKPNQQMTMPTPDGVSPLQDPTVFVSPYVRVVAEGEDNSTTIRTLESLLKYGTANFGREDDTPFLAPSADPASASAGSFAGGSVNCPAELAAMLKLNGSIDACDIAGLGSDDDEVALIANNSMGYASFNLGRGNSNLGAKPPSPGLQFSLDGVATPNTWGAIACTDMSKGSMPMDIALPPATDPHAGRGAVDFCSGLSTNKSISTPESSMYRFLMNDYCRESDVFGYRSAAPEQKLKFMSRIRDLCAKVSSILEQECLMGAVSTPVYVLGDVHGNFCDLSYFLKSVLAFNDIHLSPCNILCLGDYVDRGAYSLECILLLLALKATAPAKVTLLRGNHEDRVVCGDKRTYGNDCFLSQCQNIFGQVDGMSVFITVTEVFRHLPLAAEIVVSNAPNNPQAPRDLADEDDWESVPNNSMAKGVGMTTPETTMSFGGDTSASQSPVRHDSNGSSGNSGGNVVNGNNQGIFGSSLGSHPSVQLSTSLSNPPKTPKNAFRVEQNSQRDVRRMFTDRNWLRRQTHVERILCTHGGIPRFSCPPKEADSLAFLRSPTFPRLLTLFPNNPLMREYQPLEVERFRNVSEEVMQRAWFTMFDLMWSDPTVDDSNVNEWGFGINTRGTTVVSFSAKAVEMFLDAYKYSMLFRAHQEKAHGIRLSKSKKVLTIFSTSNYLGHGNGAGCAVVSPYGEVQLIVKTSE